MSLHYQSLGVSPALICLWPTPALSDAILRFAVEAVASEDFRKTLVTGSENLPTNLHCEHLTKFIFALYMNAKEGVRFTADALFERLKAFVVEMAGRGAARGAVLTDFCESVPLFTAEELIRMVPSEDAIKVRCWLSSSIVVRICAGASQRGKGWCLLSL